MLRINHCKVLAYQLANSALRYHDISIAKMLPFFTSSKLFLMKYTATTLFLFLISVFFTLQLVQAQPYHNEWVDYSKTYYKIRIAEEGIYRISLDVIGTTSLPATGNGFQLYYLGKQLPIYTSTDGDFSNTDFIEFYGEANKGTFDTSLFTNPEWQLTTTRSLFTDTATYFLTWSDEGEHLRYNHIENDLSDTPAPSPYFTHNIKRSLNNKYYSGRAINSEGLSMNYADFEANEGFIGPTILGGNTNNYNLNTPPAYEGIGAFANAFIKVIGQSDNLLFDDEHHIRVSLNANLYSDFFINNYDTETSEFEVDLNHLSSPLTAFNVASIGDVISNDLSSVVELGLSYTSEFSFNDTRSFAFALNDNTAQYLEISDFNAGVIPRLYDLTNHLRINATEEAGVLKINLPEGDTSLTERQLFLLNTTDGMTIKSVEVMRPAFFNNYDANVQQGNYIIISHPDLSQGTNPVIQYHDYRSSAAGGGYTVQTVFIHQLYDQFAYGIEKHPLAIRNFINYAIDTWNTPPEQVLLLGKAVTYNQTTFSTSNYNDCLIPSYGHQASDNMLVTRNSNSYLPQVGIGRVPAATPEEAQAYLDKLITYQASYNNDTCNFNQLWRKHILQLVQGDDIQEVGVHNSFSNNFSVLLTEEGFGAHLLGSYANEFPLPQEMPELGQHLSDGVGLMFYMGDASLEGYWKIDLEEPELYDNEGKYPFVISHSPFTGNIHQPVVEATGMAQDYVLAANRGAIGFLANASYTIDNIASDYTQELIRNFAQNNYGQTIGSAILETIANTYDETAVGEENLMRMLAQNLTLVGDPALVIVPRANSEISIPETNFTFYNPSLNFQILSNPLYITDQIPYIETRMIVDNLGKAVADSIQVEVQRITPTGNILPIYEQRFAAPFYRDTVWFNIPNNLTDAQGINSFIIFVNTDDVLTEDCLQNNVHTQSTIISTYCGVFLPEDVYVLHPDSLPITINAGNFDHLNYLWSTGETDAEITISDLGNYTVTVSNDAGCYTTQTITVQIGTSINEINQQTVFKDLQIYPNPSSHQLHITGIASAQINMLNMAGQTVLSTEVLSNNQPLNIQHLPSGTYLLQIIKDEAVVVAKVVKQ